MEQPPIAEKARHIEGEITITMVGKPTITIVIWRVHRDITASIKMKVMLFRGIRHIKTRPHNLTEVRGYGESTLQM